MRDHNKLVSEIKASWAWIGLDPSEVVAENDFGNLVVRDFSGRYWRICPEELACEVIAGDRAAYDALVQDPEFITDWTMDALVQAAQASLGPLAPGQKYSLATPAILGGRYETSNIKTISLIELIRFSGDVGFQIKDLPDGTEIVIKVC